MRKIIISLGYMLTCLVASGQYVDNLLDLDLGVVVVKPMGKKTLNGSPTLFSNYTTGFGLNFAARYQLSNGIIAGAKWTGVSHQSHNEPSIKILEEPTSFTQQLLLVLGYKLGPSLLEDRLVLTGFIESGLSIHRLEVASYKIFSEFPLEQETRLKETDFTANLIGRVSYDASSKQRYYLTLGYQFIKAGHVTYEETSFHGLQVSVGITLKLLRNRYYQYGL